jgi:hypothetical protein
MFSVRQAKQYPLKRITHRRNAMMLVRLVLDSRILIDLVGPETVFAQELKTKCAELHRENFRWLLDPARISIDGPARKRALDIFALLGSSSRWGEIELLLRECMRPSAVLMDPADGPSMRSEVDVSYLSLDTDLSEPPGFGLRPCRAEYRSLLPAFVVCGPIIWRNTDLRVHTGKQKADTVDRRLSKK